MVGISGAIYLLLLNLHWHWVNGITVLSTVCPVFRADVCSYLSLDYNTVGFWMSL